MLFNYNMYHSERFYFYFLLKFLNWYLILITIVYAETEIPNENPTTPEPVNLEPTSFNSNNSNMTDPALKGFWGTVVGGIVGGIIGGG